MLTAKIQKALNSQVDAEFYSSHLYLSMSAYLQTLNLKGLSHWMRIQAQEEHQHAMKFLDFISERGGAVQLGKVDAPPAEWSSPLAIFEAAYEHECSISASINQLTDLAVTERDHASNVFLQWFVTEQVEEEGAAQEIRDKLRLAGDNGAALFMMDQELGQRVAAPVGP